MLGLIFFGHSSFSAPANKTKAEAAARGWLAEQPSHLAARLHSRIRSTESFANFHVVHLDPEGFVVVANDDELEPVLAFADKGDFTIDADNPLWILLNRDVPARKAQLQSARTKQVRTKAGSSGRSSTDSPAEEKIISNAERAAQKWERYENHLARSEAAVKAIAHPSPVQSASATANPVSVAEAESSSAESLTAPPIRILDMTLVDGHVRLTHDSSASVSIYSSYDGGQTWQVEDSGVVWPTWTSKRKVQEASCWYRMAVDQAYDSMAVSLMREPPPATASLDSMPNAFAPDPTTEPGLAGSVGSVSDIRVAPLVQSLWNQSTAGSGNCYNYYTPNNYVCGCVATAMSQLMRYWQHPTSGIGQLNRTIYVNGSTQSATTRGGDGSGGAYNWSSMPLNPNTSSYNAAQWQMIGSLCYDAGVSVNMQYSAGGSGAYMTAAATALTGVFKYASAKYINRPSNLIQPTASNLAAGRPVLFGISSSGQNGHAVVCDGFGYDGGALYFHINMGWAGSYNYWYALPYLETSYQFNSIDTIIYNIFPTGTGELLTGRVTTSQGAPVSGATIVAAAGGQNYSNTSDSKGYYGIQVPSGQTYSVTASRGGMGSSTRTGVAVGNSGPSACGNAIGINFTLNNNFSFRAVGLSNCVWLRWLAPTNCGLPNNTVYIRSRTDHAPVNSSDGSLVYSGTALAFEHTGVNNSGSVTNYYTIWGNDGSPYADLGPAAATSAMADNGTVRLLWTGASGEVSFRNLRNTGLRKSGGSVSSTLLDVNYWKVGGFNDIDGDGGADILWTGAGGEVYYWLLNADGTLRTSGSVTPGVAPRNGTYTVAGFGDIDRDGTADVLWMGADGTVSYWLLNANGTRKSSGLVTPGVPPRSGVFTAIGFNDIDRDGTADVLWMGSDGTVSFWLLNATGTRKSSGLVTPGVAPRSGKYSVAGFQDLDADGTADVIWFGADGTVSYWLLNANGTRKSSGLVSSTKLSPASYWQAVGLTDVNMDGVPDIIWRGLGGETYCWFLNSGGTFKSSANLDPVPVSASYWTVRGAGRVGH